MLHPEKVGDFRHGLMFDLFTFVDERLQLFLPLSGVKLERSHPRLQVLTRAQKSPEWSNKAAECTSPTAQTGLARPTCCRGRGRAG